jgi:hypothetical protein
MAVCTALYYEPVSEDIAEKIGIWCEKNNKTCLTSVFFWGIKVSIFYKILF